MKLTIRLFTIVFFCSLSFKTFAAAPYAGDAYLLDINGSPSRNTETAGIAWNNVGSKLFVMGTGGLNNDDDELLEYTCLTNFDASSCVYVRELPLNNLHEGPNGPINDRHPFGFTFDDDGSHVYVSGNQTNKIYEIELGSAFDLSSATKTQQIASVDVTPCGITFNNDGTKLFLAGFNGHKIVVWPLSTAYSLASGSVGTPAEYDVSTQSSRPRDIDFNSDGTKMYIVSADDNEYVSVYSLNTAFDLSAGFSHLGNFTTVSDQDEEPFSIEFNNDGTKFYMNGYQTDSVYEYDVDSEGSAFDLGFTDPTLTSSVPADNATGVAVDATIVLNFSENVDTESGNITIKKGNAVIETIDVTDTDRVSGTGTSQITITPSSNFEDLTEFYVLIDPTAFDDVDGRSYAGIPTDTEALSFTTTNTVPTLTSSVPADNATGVAVDATIVLNFSENVDTESGNITIKKTSGDAVVETINVTDTDRVSGTGTSQITITPSSNFDNNTEYYVLIAGTAFDDSSNGSYAGIPTSKTTLSFTTTNAVPTLTSSVPADNAPDVERDASIILNFSENVDAESGNITIKKKSGNSIFETIDVTSGQVTGSGTSEITINPSSNFDAKTEYYILIDASAFDNSSSGSYAGISSTTALSFTVKAMVDPTTDKDVIGTIDAQNMMAKNTLTGFTSLVNDRLRYLRQNRINKDFTKNNIKLDFGNAMLTTLAKVIPTSSIYLTNEILTSLVTVTPVSNIYLTDYIPENWSSWSEGSVSMTKVGDNKNSSSKDIDVQSLALGFDTKLNNNDLLGFAMQFSQSDTEVGTSGTDIDSNNYSLSAYRTRPLNDDNFVEGLFGVVLIESDLKRVSGANTLTGSRNGTQVFGSINYGKTLVKEDFNLTPIARVDLGYTELDGYTETGTDALTYGKQTAENGLASIGLEINDIIKFSDSSLKPFGSFQYGLDFSNSSDVKMNYVSDTSTIYTYTPGINSTHLLTAEAGFNYELKDHLKLTGIFKRIQGSGSQQTNNIRFGFHYISQRETEYAMSLDGSDELKTGLNISKNINGFDIKLGSNYSLMSQIPDYGVSLKISNKF
ncbi:Ig-like domain-containing protein [Candidatus Pelagibacter bacterium]|nr:Ig-like domain-containing protein [Candidatus Pelagibacter bacterium]